MDNENQDELRDLRGGEKRMWLRQHRDEVLEYLGEHGEEVTKKRYHLTHDTLDRVIRPEGGHYPRFTRYDALELKFNMAMAAMEDLRGELRELGEQFAKFQESVGEQLKQNFLLPLLAAVFKLPPELELKPKPDSLDVEALIKQASGDEPGVEEPERYDVVAEAEEMLSSEDQSLQDVTTGSLDEQLHAASGKLYDLYIKACEREDWGDALCMHQWIDELDCIREDEEGEEFIEAAKDWLAKVAKPGELYICY